MKTAVAAEEPKRLIYQYKMIGKSDLEAEGLVMEVGMKALEKGAIDFYSCKGFGISDPSLILVLLEGGKPEDVLEAELASNFILHGKK